MTRSRPRSAALALVAASALLIAGSTSGALAQDTKLRIAMGSPGEAGIRVWEDVATQFEASHPGVDVDINFMQDDLYEQIGLQNLLAAPNAPDIYFEWTGSRMAQRYADGYAADLTEYTTSGPLSEIFDPALFGAATIDGKVVLVPHTADVTNVLWFNTALLEANGVTPPTTWAELLAACDTLSAAGIIPISTGNKDLWAAGNWLSHLASRVVGEDVYDATLKGGTFATPEWEQAFGYIKELVDHRCVNDSANAIDDNSGAQLFFQGKAAMHPIGSWLVSWAIDEAPDLDFDFVNLPAMPEGAKGDQGSVIGVETGYIVNAKSQNIPLAVEFLTLLNSPENVQAFITEAEITPLAPGLDTSGVDSRSARLQALLSGAPATVLPPDTGYDLKMANALYAAEAAVLGGQQSPADALASIDAQLGR